jgi:hypothetical protein
MNVTKVCAYMMRWDSGLAPNPFHGVCTLALCTPNHMRADLGRGDWIIGLAAKDVRHRFFGDADLWRMIYAMRVDDRLTLDDYYHRPEYRRKRPDKSGSRLRQCGDNFYKITAGEIRHTGESTEHQGMDHVDGYGDRVFVGQKYWYFGRSALALPATTWALKLRSAFQPVAVGIRYLMGGDRTKWIPEDFRSFETWLEQQQPPADPDPIHFDRWDAQRVLAADTQELPTVAAGSGTCAAKPAATPVPKSAGKGCS